MKGPELDSRRKPEEEKYWSKGPDGEETGASLRTGEIGKSKNSDKGWLGEYEETTGPKSAADDNRERSNLSRSVVVPQAGNVA
jgi:hypothetical protein